jgi:hypothetical protein
VGCTRLMSMKVGEQKRQKARKLIERGGRVAFMYER